MKCPECGKEMKKGVVEVKDGSLFLTSVVVSWCPEDERKKLLRKNAISLRLNAEGHYCDECMKVFAAFEERSI